jgi:DNA-binding transcriptional regulator YiaG
MGNHESTISDGRIEMPNIASILKVEIVRLARKELRAETEALKKAVAHYRSDISGLKRSVASLEKQLARMEKKTSGQVTSDPSPEGAGRMRFSAKGLASKRQKLGLSAAEMGILLGVSAQTIYNWEAEKSKPRQAQLAAIAAVRDMGKRQAKARLEEMANQ